ncbi:hypothetical protein [Methylomonas sp. AM2-LC]|uniref:hypothetical protein n=1 Tax=Methylomonas sp. AM2-LC TaxID=3153301 RepID=UPI0032666F6A
MQPFKLLVTVLLCFMLSIQGGVSQSLLGDMCSKTDGSVSQTQVDDEHSCCQDTLKVTKTGKICKAEQSCQGLNYAVLNKLEPLTVVVTTNKIPLLANQLVLSFQPFNTWRPPNLI